METRTLAFEIGTEEIPAAALYAATEQLQKLAASALDEAGLEYAEVKTMSTPRRIILMVDALAVSTQAQTLKAKGPSAKIAFDEDGNPTKAALGFARGKGIDAENLVREIDEQGQEYVYAIVEKPAVAADALLPDLLANLITGLSWPKSQRWGSRHETFSRPVRWLLALFGEQIIPVEFAGLVAGNKTRGHRLIANKEFEIASADELLSSYEEMWVVPSAQKRAQIIREQIAALEEKTGLKADMPKKVFDEVVNLVEYPTVLLGHFDERFLDVPPEIITDAMLEHQRYFPMYREDGSLDNAFIITGNGHPDNSEVITQGNERVVRARLDDAAFFVAEDLRTPLEGYVDGLENVVFQDKLGTVRAKVERICRNAAHICDDAGIDGQDKEDALRAALLAKADLITSAVVEFTSLQGIMGGHYAKAAGESDACALAITDHYRPRFAGDDLPRNMAGKVVALSDKIDTICGIFAIGQGPTGSSDPFALRRSAIGIINILLDGPAASLSSLIDSALHTYDSVVDFNFDEVSQQIRDFFKTRLEVIAKDKGYSADAIQAVVAVGMFEPVETLARINALESARKDQPELFEDLATAYTRAANLRDAKLGTDVDESLMGESEKLLLEAIAIAQHAVDSALEVSDHGMAIEALAALREPIDTFFDDVMIMDEDMALRENRLKLLNRFADVFTDVADISKLA